jgi:hypothetical protein
MLYQDNKILLDEFIKMKIQLEKFKESLNDFEQGFIESVNEAHVAQNSN